MENSSMNTGTRFELVMAKREATGLCYMAPIGYSILWPDTRYYLVKLWMFGGQSFFLSPLKKDPSRFTLFAKKKVHADGTTTLINPVGHGVITPELPEYIELRLKLLGKTIYMSLIPGKPSEAEEDLAA